MSLTPRLLAASRQALKGRAFSPCIRIATPGLMLAQRRWASTIPETKLTPQENIAYLNTQREKRPMSPHLAIYQPQITWLLSIANRMTGVALSGVLYVGAIAYLAHPAYSFIDSAHLIDLVHSFPVWVKGGIKLLFAVPFTFHTFNGIRHLAWDVGYGLTLKGVYAGGYAVMGLTAVSSLYLAFFT